jgi:hypothetical protein
MFQLSEIRAMRHAFFGAVAVGYAYDAPARVEESTGAKIIEFNSNGFIVQDRWWLGRDDFSFGTCLMLYEGKPVWSMSYRGAYAKRAIPCLKHALQENYRAEIFYGGRGPRTFRYENLIYHNTPKHEGIFHEFWGMESVRVRSTSEAIGWYRYHGGLLGDWDRP